MTVTNLLRQAYDLAIKVRLIREHQKAHIAAVGELSDRELLALQILQSFAPINESALGRALGVQSSSLSDLVKRLEKRKLIDKQKSSGDERQRTLTMSRSGRELLDRVKRKSALRYWYLFQNCVIPAEAERLLKLLSTMEQNADRELNRVVFGHEFEADESTLQQLLGLQDLHVTHGEPPGP